VKRSSYLAISAVLAIMFGLAFFVNIREYFIASAKIEKALEIGDFEEAEEMRWYAHRFLRNAFISIFLATTLIGALSYYYSKTKSY